MTPEDAARQIITYWCLGHNPASIMLYLVMQRFPFSTAQVCVCIRQYCNARTETRRPQAGVIPNP
jgi:hypothetical protein